MRAIQARNYGYVEVEREDGTTAAVGKLVLTSDDHGAIDFIICGTSAPGPGRYLLCVEGKRLAATLISPGRAGHTRLLVELEQPLPGSDESTAGSASGRSSPR